MAVNLIESVASQLARALNDTVSPAAVGYLYGAKVHLTRASLDLTVNTPLADLATAEADFTGYAAATLTWDVPGLGADGTVEVVTTPIVFRPTDAVVPNNIFACYITDSGSTAWYFLGLVDGSPVPLPDALHQMILTLYFHPATQSWSVTLS